MTAQISNDAVRKEFRECVLFEHVNTLPLDTMWCCSLIKYPPLDVSRAVGLEELSGTGQYGLFLLH